MRAGIQRMGGGSASTNPITMGHTHPPDTVEGWVWHCQESHSNLQFIGTASVTRQAIPPEAKESQEVTTIKCYQVFSQPWKTLCKYSECIQLRKGDVPNQLNTANPWEPGNRSFWAWGWPLYLTAPQKHERCSVLTAENTGNSADTFWAGRTGTGLCTAIPKSTGHQRSQKLTKALPQPWGRPELEQVRPCYNAWRTASLSSWYSPCPSCAMDLMWK